MEFAIVQETVSGEERVALTPEGARALVDAGNHVRVQAGAGARAGFSDIEYRAAGAQLVYSDFEAASQSDVLLRVRPPSDDELELITPESVLVGFLGLAGGSPAVLQRLVGSGSSAIALELIEDDGRRAVVDPMSAIAGRVAMALVQEHLTRRGGGHGVLLGGSPGVPPCRVAVVGAGAAGLAAARAAKDHGAEVAVLDISPSALLRASERFPGLVTVGATTYNMQRYVEWADVVVGAVARRGEPAPKVLTRTHVRSMRSGALLLDLSIDEGGCAQTSRATTPQEPVFEAEGVRHLCIPNLPSLVARTASEALSIATLPWLLQLGAHGLDGAVRREPRLARPTQVFDGVITCAQVARYHRTQHQALSQLVSGGAP